MGMLAVVMLLNAYFNKLIVDFIHSAWNFINAIVTQKKNNSNINTNNNNNKNELISGCKIQNEIKKSNNTVDCIGNHNKLNR